MVIKIKVRLSNSPTRYTVEKISLSKVYLMKVGTNLVVKISSKYYLGQVVQGKKVLVRTTTHIYVDICKNTDKVKAYEIKGVY